MIIGNGDIASVIEDDEEIVYFASGVSNSCCQDEKEFDLERGMLMRYVDSASFNGRKLVYFSSLECRYGLTKYYFHKREMERIAKESKHSLIIRIGNITWGKNPNTLINYLKQNPDAEIKDSYRYLITKEAFLHWLEKTKKDVGEINLIGETLKVQEIKDRIDRGEL